MRVRCSDKRKILTTEIVHFGGNPASSGARLDGASGGQDASGIKFSLLEGEDPLGLDSLSDGGNGGAEDQTASGFSFANVGVAAAEDGHARGGKHTGALVAAGEFIDPLGVFMDGGVWLETIFIPPPSHLSKRPCLGRLFSN